MKEAGRLTSSVKDIGPLINEVKEDIFKEEQKYIMEKLFSHFWPEISRGVILGLPEWYKEELTKEILNAPTDNATT